MNVILASATKSRRRSAEARFHRDKLEGSDSRIVRAACHAHARRKFFDAKENHSLLASQFLALYQQLYDVEDCGRPLSPADRQALRESDARPICCPR